MRVTNLLFTNPLTNFQLVKGLVVGCKILWRTEVKGFEPLVQRMLYVLRCLYSTVS